MLDQLLPNQEEQPQEIPPELAGQGEQALPPELAALMQQQGQAMPDELAGLSNPPSEDQMIPGSADSLPTSPMSSLPLPVDELSQPRAELMPQEEPATAEDDDPWQLKHPHQIPQHASIKEEIRKQWKLADPKRYKALVKKGELEAEVQLAHDEHVQTFGAYIEAGAGYYPALEMARATWKWETPEEEHPLDKYSIKKYGIPMPEYMHEGDEEAERIMREYRKTHPYA